MTGRGIVSDPPGLRFRIFLRRRRLHLQRAYLKAAAKVRGSDVRPVRPVFLIGCPRSGTTLLFRLLRRHPSLATLPGEGHVLWSTFHHPRDSGWDSDRVTGGDIAPDEPRFIYTGIDRIAGEARFLDKTPRNCLRVPYLAALFPDATFILLTRDAPDTVSSLIEGWTVRHGVSYRLPHELHLREYRGRLWSYVLPPDWKSLAHSSFAEVAARQYVASYETALEDLAELPPERVVTVGFEDVLGDPVGVTGKLLTALDLPPSDAVRAMASDLGSYPVQTNSAPRPDKWLDRFEDIARVFPTVAPTRERLGYTHDVLTAAR